MKTDKTERSTRLKTLQPAESQGGLQTLIIATALMKTEP